MDTNSKEISMAADFTLSHTSTDDNSGTGDGIIRWFKLSENGETQTFG